MSGSISVSGLLRNMLDEGFNTKDCIGEMIDDSLGAGAKQIRISLDTVKKEILFSDDGCGMTKEKLRNAHILHNRSEASEVKHGRFGIGRKHALSHFTQNKYPVTTISKCEDTGLNEKIGKGVNELHIDYAEAIKKNVLDINPHAVSVDSLDIWTKNAVASNKKGTITHMPVDELISAEIEADMKSSDISTSLRYTLGLHYNQIINDGVKMTFILDGKEYSVNAYDPLGLTMIPSEDKSETKIQIVRDAVSKDTRFVFSNNGKQTYRKINPDSGKYKNYTDIPSSFKKIGEITLIATYSSDWLGLLSTNLSKMGVKSENKGKLASAELLGGTWIQRNKKIISRFATIRPGTDNFDKREATLNAHYLLRFQASEEMDDIFKVMTNKSKLDEENINKDLWDTIKFLRGKFVNEKYTPPAAVTVPTPPTSPQTIPTPAPATVTVPIPTPVPTPAPPPVPAPIPVTAPVTAPVTPATPAPQAVVNVPAHTKLVPQSQLTLVMKMESLLEESKSFNWDKLKKNAKSSTDPGMSKMIETLEEAMKTIRSIS